jgi:hypothetical protein
MIRKLLVLLVAVSVSACDPIGPNSPDAIANKIASAVAYSSYCGSDRYTEKAMMLLVSSPYEKDFGEGGKYRYKIAARILELKSEAGSMANSAFCTKLDAVFR